MRTRLRYAFRSLRQAPLLSLVVIGSLALGIGANSAIFTIFNHLLLAKLPVPDPEQVVMVKAPGAPRNGSVSTRSPGDAEYVFSYRMFREMTAKPQPQVELAAFCPGGVNAAYGGQTEPVGMLMVSGGYFNALRVAPALGRILQPSDDSEGGGNPVVMVSHRFWTQKMGGTITALNQTIRLSGRLYTVVGVTPRDFFGTTPGDTPDLYVPLASRTIFSQRFKPERYNDYWLYLAARVRPGYTAAQAQAALNPIYHAIVEQQAAAMPAFESQHAAKLRASNLKLEEGSRGHSFMQSEARTPLLILMCATAMVLLIAMANAANLLLARSAERRRELAIRSALGAGRGEIVWQSLTEALLLAAGGAAAGIAIGVATLKVLLTQIPSPEDMPPALMNATLDWRLLLYAVAVSLVTGVLFGLYPALDASRVSPAGALNEESGRSSGGRGSSLVRRGLVCAQVMISALLLIPTGLFLRSLVNLTHVDLGVRTEKLITFSIEPSRNGYTPEQTRVLLERTEAALSAIPGVTGVSASVVPLIGGDTWMNTLTVEGMQSGPGIDTNSNINMVGPGYFANLGVPLINGRDIQNSDTQAAPKVAVVNEQFAKDFFKGANPIGRRIGVGWGNDVKMDVEIVGMVKNAHYANVREKQPRIYYTAWRQDKDTGSMCYFVRTALPEGQMIRQIRQVVRGIDPNVPARDLRTLDEQISKSIQSDRLVLGLSGVFAALATLLAMLGLYGVMAHSVTRRTREIGIRLALGAQAGRIRMMVLREMLLILAIGLAVGVPAALATGKFTESQLFGVKSGDPTVVALAALSLALAATAAGYLPALRASRVDPQTALRHD